MDLKEICTAVSRGALMGGSGKLRCDFVPDFCGGFTMSIQNQKQSMPCLWQPPCKKGVEVAYKKCFEAR